LLVLEVKAFQTDNLPLFLDGYDLQFFAFQGRRYDFIEVENEETVQFERVRLGFGMFSPNGFDIADIAVDFITHSCDFI
jgi:hypothetical protein